MQTLVGFFTISHLTRNFVIFHIPHSNLSIHSPTLISFPPTLVSLYPELFFAGGSWRPFSAKKLRFQSLIQAIEVRANHAEVQGPLELGIV